MLAFQAWICPLNAADTFAFVANYDGGDGDTVSRCPVDPEIGVFGECVDSGAGTAFEGPAEVVFNAAGTFAFVTNLRGGNNTVTRCAVDPETGIFNSASCQDSGAGPGFDGPAGIVLSSV